MDALLPLGGNLVPVMINRKNINLMKRFSTENIGNDRLIGDSLELVQPTRFKDNSSELTGLSPIITGSIWAKRYPRYRIHRANLPILDISDQPHRLPSK